MSEREPNQWNGLKKGAWSWALYDWANTGFAMVGLALILPGLYNEYFAAPLTTSQTTTAFGATLTMGSLLVFLLAPVLGAIGEIGNIRKRLLLRFAAVGCLAMTSLYFVGEGRYLLASLIHIVGMVSFYSGNLFFDSMLSKVAEPRSRHLASGISYAFGYAAGFALIGIIVFVSTQAGPGNEIAAQRLMFPIAAVWWVVFTIPLIINIKETPDPNRPPLPKMARQGAVEAWGTLKEILRTKTVFWFLLAYLCYSDGVYTVITMATSYGKTIGFSMLDILGAFTVVQVFGVPAAVFYGWIAGKVGPRRMIFFGIGSYLVVVTFGASLVNEDFHLFGFGVPRIWLLGALIGVVQGGIQAVSRSYFTSIIPAGRESAFFGFYSMIGKSAAVMGPALVAFCSWAFNDPTLPDFSTRIGMWSLSLLFILGAAFLWRCSHFARKDEARAGGG